MELENRVRELREKGERELVERLVRGVISGADPDDISIAENRVIIEHERFSGVHTIKEDTSDGREMEKRGEYVFTGQDGSLDIELTASNLEVAKSVEGELDELESGSESEAQPSKPRVWG